MLLHRKIVNKQVLPEISLTFLTRKISKVIPSNGYLYKQSPLLLPFLCYDVIVDKAH